MDPETLRRAQAGDEAAFGVLMRAHHDQTFRLVWAILRHEQDARDISQEVWLTVWRELPKFRGDAKFSTWLHAIATRRALDHLRRRRRWFDRFLPFARDDGTELEPADESTLANASADPAGDRVESVRRALDALPPKLRAVLALREMEGLAYDEIAAVLSVPTGTVMSRLYNARRLLAQKLGAKP